MMTEQQIFNEIQALPLAARLNLLEKITRDVRESFERETQNGAETKKLKVNLDERKAAIQRLRGIAKVENQPAPTDEEVEESYANYLLEKYS